MDDREKIERVLLGDKRQYSDFIGSFFHHGRYELHCGYQDCNNFSYGTNMEAYHRNDLYIKADDADYFKQAIRNRPDLTHVFLLSSDDNMELSEYEGTWLISKRKQFTKSEEGSADPTDFCLLDDSHRQIVEKSESDRSRECYSMAMEYEDCCYGLIRNNELLSFIFVPEVTKPTELANISWIYTESVYRKMGYASKLLQNVSNLYIRQGYLVAYQCAEDNVASAKTALKSGMSREADIICFERI